jgi:hypothetical protein
MQHRFLVSNNSHDTTVNNFQYKFSLNVSRCIIFNRLTGPDIYEGCISGLMCLAFLQNELSSLLGDVPLVAQLHICLYHGGAPPYFYMLLILVSGLVKADQLLGHQDLQTLIPSIFIYGII